MNKKRAMEKIVVGFISFVILFTILFVIYHAINYIVSTIAIFIFVVTSIASFYVFGHMILYIRDYIT